MTEYARTPSEAYDKLRAMGASPDETNLLIERVREYKTYSLGKFYLSTNDGKSIMIQKMEEETWARARR